MSFSQRTSDQQMAPNQKNERLKSLEKKYEKFQKQLFTVALLIISSGSSRKFPKKRISSSDLQHKKIPYHAVSLY